MKANNRQVIEADLEAESKWVARVNEIGENTVMPHGKNSWYMGASVPGKPRVILP